MESDFPPCVLVGSFLLNTIAKFIEIIRLARTAGP